MTDKRVRRLKPKRARLNQERGAACTRMLGIVSWSPGTYRQVVAVAAPLAGSFVEVPGCNGSANEVGLGKASCAGCRALRCQWIRGSFGPDQDAQRDLVGLRLGQLERGDPKRERLLGRRDIAQARYLLAPAKAICSGSLRPFLFNSTRCCTSKPRRRSVGQSSRPTPAGV
jgi:hypothetical protein